MILTPRKPEYYEKILSESTREDWKEWLQNEFSPENRMNGIPDEYHEILNEWYITMMTELIDDMPTETIIDIVNLVLELRYDVMLDPDYENWERPIFYNSETFLAN
jgi:hypothetical protein